MLPVLAVVALVFILSSASYSSRTGGGASSYNRAGTRLATVEQQAVSNATRDACARVMTRQKNLLFDTFSDVFEGVRNIALISIPDHENKVRQSLHAEYTRDTSHDHAPCAHSRLQRVQGDSAIMLAESMLLAALGINVVYSCGVKDCNMDTLAQIVDEYGGDHFAIAFHGGGNFGDLYQREHNLKLDVMSAYPDVRMHVFPQSLKFRSDETMQATKAVLAKLKHASIAVRDNQSLEFAMKHFAHPGLRVDMTPDIVFYMGFRPELRSKFGAPEHDVLLFRRADGERTNWDFAGGANSPDFPRAFVETLPLDGDAPLTYKAGDWSGDFDITPQEKGQDGSAHSHIEFRSWRRFMLGAEWLSSGDFVILDRLHGEPASQTADRTCHFSRR